MIIIIVLTFQCLRLRCLNSVRCTRCSLKSEGCKLNTKIVWSPVAYNPRGGEFGSENMDYHSVHFCVAYTKCIATICYDLIYLFIYFISLFIYIFLYSSYYTLPFIFLCLSLLLQWNPDFSNLQGKNKLVREIGSSRNRRWHQITLNWPGTV